MFLANGKEFSQLVSIWQVPWLRNLIRQSQPGRPDGRLSTTRAQPFQCKEMNMT